ncbi:uracil-DNA glycosylase [Peribacillus deserti]|uniref:Uracil-DNA glycosylase n=1 Tax=Peribacillus deserti TaxID=673318 RepID=A0A2N5M809_9BACI|nr:uracil-DNA glycosylase [Peribacillus deserti]PLT30486.1 uracil-DNA glycosylase [Peribacillus deserti]
MSSFCGELWPEIQTPEGQRDCRECGLFRHGTRMVWGEGNPAGKLMVILDNPGAREDKEGTPFVCSTRQTLQRAAYDAGLTKNDLYITYILKRRPIRAYDKELVRKTCMLHLGQQLAENMPKLILCLGNVAVQSFFQDPNAEVRKLRGKWHDIQGIPTAAAYHPLAVKRRPNLWPVFREDWLMTANRFFA